MTDTNKLHVAMNVYCNNKIVVSDNSEYLSLPSTTISGLASFKRDILSAIRRVLGCYLYDNQVSVRYTKIKGMAALIVDVNIFTDIPELKCGYKWMSIKKYRTLIEAEV